MDRGAWRATARLLLLLSRFSRVRPEQPLGRGSALPRLGAELELRRSGSSLGQNANLTFVHQITKYQHPHFQRQCEITIFVTNQNIHYTFLQMAYPNHVYSQPRLL